jgi:glycosyltransferase involved in cell wall biosynthesis
MRLWGKVARVIICCSEFVRDEAVKRYGIPYHKTRVIHMPPFLDLTRRVRKEEDEVFLARCGLPSSYILNIGWQGSHKNNLVLIRAFEALKWRGYPAPPLVLAGNQARELLLGNMVGAYFHEFRRVLRSSQLREGHDYFILNYVAEEDVPSLISRAAVCVSVSRSEASLNGMIMEAMFYESPLVASAIPQVTERLGHDHRYALLVPPDDHVALADAIQEVLDHPAEAQQRVRRASQFIRQHTWEDAAKDYLEALRDACLRDEMSLPIDTDNQGRHLTLVRLTA